MILGSAKPPAGTPTLGTHLLIAFLPSKSNGESGKVVWIGKMLNFFGSNGG